MGRKPKVKTEKFDEKKMETAYDFGNITVPTKWDEVTLQMLSDYLALSKEKEEALSILMKTQTGKDFTFNEKLVSIVAVIRIDIEEYTAKRREVPYGAKK